MITPKKITKGNFKEIILNNQTGTPLIADKLTILKKKGFKHVDVKSKKYKYTNSSVVTHWTFVEEVKTYFDAISPPEDFKVQLTIYNEQLLSLKEFIYCLFKDPQILIEKLTNEDILTLYLKIQRYIYTHLLYLTLIKEGILKESITPFDIDMPTIDIQNLSKDKDVFLENLQIDLKSITKSIALYIQRNLIMGAGMESAHYKELNSYFITLIYESPQFEEGALSKGMFKKVTGVNSKDNFKISRPMITDIHYILRLLKNHFNNDSNMRIYFSDPENKQLHMYISDILIFYIGMVKFKGVYQDKFEVPALKDLFTMTVWYPGKEKGKEELTFISLEPSIFDKGKTPKKISKTQYANILKSLNIVKRNMIDFFFSNLLYKI